MRFHVAWLLASVLGTHAQSYLSAFEDLLAHPHYQVLMVDELVPYSVASALLSPSSPSTQQHHTDISTERKAPDTKTQSQDVIYRRLLLRGTTGQRYLCSIPNAANSGVQTNDITQEDSHQTRRKRIERGLELLEPLKEDCLLYPDGWWVYEYCHERYIRQMHPTEQGKTPGTYLIPRVDDRHAISNFLGVFNVSPDPADQSDSSSDKSDRVIPMSVVKRTSLYENGEQNVLVQRWAGGTVCDVTKKPRKIEVQFSCHINEQISFIKEVSTCQYVMSIQTPRLCQENTFLPKIKEPVNNIECRPVVSDALYEVESARREVMRKEQEQEQEQAKRQAEATQRSTERPSSSTSSYEDSKARLITQTLRQILKMDLPDDEQFIIDIDFMDSPETGHADDDKVVAAVNEILRMHGVQGTQNQQQPNAKGKDEQMADAERQKKHYETLQKVVQDFYDIPVKERQKYDHTTKDSLTDESMQQPRKLYNPNVIEQLGRFDREGQHQSGTSDSHNEKVYETETESRAQEAEKNGKAHHDEL
ncbi:hypothetical protein BZG36_02105 [Bifiguratus adelaidae]|uniref:Protein OS-9 homolog n=1 Tax=Bifiguratus adelaidae TaxID=1938954 RepID=A0A261Y381_9FUNG|nr:hypothetical protein BZG36_02105 [Bifiguratus adelaidae]